MKKLQTTFSAVDAPVVRRTTESDIGKADAEYRNSTTMRKKCACIAGKRLAFLFSLEAAFSLTLVIVAATYLFAFAPQKESAGEFLACSDAAGALLKMRSFSTQETLQAAVGEAGGLLGVCVEAESPGLSASSCKAGEGGVGEKYSSSFPIWKEGRVENARVGCYRREWHGVVLFIFCIERVFRVV